MSVIVLGASRARRPNGGWAAPNAMKTFPIDDAWIGIRLPDPVAGAERVVAVDLRERGRRRPGVGMRDVRRLARRLARAARGTGRRASRGRRRLESRRAYSTSTGPGPEAAAAAALREPVPLERAQEARGRRLRQLRLLHHAGERHHVVALDEPDENPRGAVDRLGFRLRPWSSVPHYGTKTLLESSDTDLLIGYRSRLRCRIMGLIRRSDPSHRRCLGPRHVASALDARGRRGARRDPRGPGRPRRASPVGRATSTGSTTRSTGMMSDRDRCRRRPPPPHVETRSARSPTPRGNGPLASRARALLQRSSRVRRSRHGHGDGGSARSSTPQLADAIEQRDPERRVTLCERDRADVSATAAPPGRPTCACAHPAAVGQPSWRPPAKEIDREDRRAHTHRLPAGNAGSRPGPLLARAAR